VVWHDEEILSSKCQDTAPAVNYYFASPARFLTWNQISDDSFFPYVGKFIANLTLAQLKTLDCGSQRQDNFRKLLNCLTVNLVKIMLIQPCNLLILPPEFQLSKRSSIS
jgi:hypothetical protein